MFTFLAPLHQTPSRRIAFLFATRACLKGELKNCTIPSLAVSEHTYEIVFVALHEIQTVLIKKNNLVSQ